MLQEPLFNKFCHSFEIEGFAHGEEKGFYGGRPVNEYGNTVVTGLFSDQDAENIESEAMIIFNVWMAVAHELYETLHECRTNYNASASLSALDRAAALWVGTDQEWGATRTVIFCTILLKSQVPDLARTTKKHGSMPAFSQD